jgi:ABC-type multidrug transport system ATPase subunit
MSEAILKALMQLFALIGDIHDDTVITTREKAIVRMFLSRHLNVELVERYMNMFEEYLSQFNSERLIKGSLQDRKRTSLNAMRILAICEQINVELRQKQKIYVLVQLVDFISLGDEITENELDFLLTVSKAFNVPENDYLNIKSFIMNQLYEFHDISRLLIIDNSKIPADEEIKHFFIQNLKGMLLFLHIPSTNTYIMRYSGSGDLYLNGQNIIAGQTYIFDTGSSVRGAGINAVYYSEVAGIISEEMYDTRVYLDASGVSYKFRNSENGIHNLDFHEDSGKLVGIIGGSGVGKSTSLSVLNGTLKPDNGEVRINGYNLYDENEKEILRGVIGYVPQDDLLIEELTVYQNLYYSARLCLNDLSEDKLSEVVNRTIADLDLEETRDLKVGNPLNKVISGGQRKRVNIALELIREPTILFVDEPTSGLSSVDSEIVMNLLKEQTYKGKLVIVNIHQPGSDIYKMFDRIMVIDKGGYQIFYGNPTEAIIYFKTLSNHANPLEDQCIICGNVNADQILQIVEAKIVDEHGRPTILRKVTPKEWVIKFRENKKSETQENVITKQDLPLNIYSIPGLFDQSRIFFIRDLLSKLSDRQYIIITLLGSPVLAMLLAWFTKYYDGQDYKFIANENIPAYLFMCVVTSMFFGLMVSSEEIVKDRKLLKRESFLNLSWFSYLNSKIMMMFLISAIQTLSFILIGNFILEIRDMNFSYWLVLFTTACFANILGLNISSAFNSVITIYIIIPFIIIPQLLFSGVLVKFDKLHKGKFATQEYVPVIGDLMTARWAFEAMAVRQFKDNEYSKRFFSCNSYISQNSYYAFLVDELANELWRCEKLTDKSGAFKDGQYSGIILDEKLKRISYHLNELKDLTGIVPGQWQTSMNAKDFNSETAKGALNFLDSLKGHFNYNRRQGQLQKDSIEKSLIAAIGKDKLSKMKDDYENNRLVFLALDQDNLRKCIYTPEKIVQKMDPGYMKTTSGLGRAHFYAPFKKIGTREIDTYTFNLSVIWMVTVILYLTLNFTLLRRIVVSVGNIRMKRSD